jgi:magnesium transporter
VIHKIEFEADSIEDDVFVAREDDANLFLRKIGRVRKNVMALMRLLGGKADVLRGFTKRCNENYKVTPRMDIGMYLGDIQDHVVTMVTNLGHFEKILSRSHSNYLAQLSINSIAQGTDTNRVLSKITFLASILVPLNLVSGLFGMNVNVPFLLDLGTQVQIHLGGELVDWQITST